MTKEGTLLVVDDNRNILTSLRFLLKDVFAAGHHPGKSRPPARPATRRKH